MTACVTYRVYIMRTHDVMYFRCVLERDYKSVACKTNLYNFVASTSTDIPRCFAQDLPLTRYRMGKIRIIIVTALVYLASYLLVAQSTACHSYEHTYGAYYKVSTNNFELCYVQVHACLGDCHNSYAHIPHKTSDYSDPRLACEWSYTRCEVTSYDTISAYLLPPCTPLNGGSSSYDINDPWVVLIRNATVCHCSTDFSGSSASECGQTNS